MRTAACYPGKVELDMGARVPISMLRVVRLLDGLVATLSEPHRDIAPPAGARLPVRLSSINPAVVVAGLTRVERPPVCVGERRRSSGNRRIRQREPPPELVNLSTHTGRRVDGHLLSSPFAAASLSVSVS